MKTKRETAYKISPSIWFSVVECADGWRIRIQTLKYGTMSYITLMREFENFEDAAYCAKVLADDVTIFAEEHKGVKIPK